MLAVSIKAQMVLRERLNSKAVQEKLCAGFVWLELGSILTQQIYTKVRNAR